VLLQVVAQRVDWQGSGFQFRAARAHFG
jgi:hypothetical protein